MRATAVLAVVCDHLFGWPSGGFVGVDIFFVLSGYFITGLLLRERRELGTLSFQRFYVRRARRIIPAALLVLLVTTIAGYVIFPAIRAKDTLLDALWASIFLANWRFERIGTDYFSEGQLPSPLQHYWSLSIEEQFYFVWPALLLSVFWITRKQHRRGHMGSRNIALTATILAICGFSFAWAVIRTADAPTSAYFATVTRVWELGVGALVAIVGPALTRLPDGFVRLVLAYAGLAGVVASLFLISAHTPFPGPGAALPVFSTALVVAAFHGSTVRGMQPLTNRAAQYFGRTSYSLYLWHWPVIVLLAAVIPIDLRYYVASVVVMLSIAHLSYTFFENPIRKSKWLERDSVLKLNGKVSLRVARQSWALMGFLMVAAVCAALMAIQILQRDSRAGEAYESLDTGEMSKFTTEANPCFGAPAMHNPGGCISNADNLMPSIDVFAKDTQGAYSCWRAQDQPMRSCTYGSEDPKAVRVALVGDSHAAMLLPGLSMSLDRYNWSLTTYLGYGCQWQVPTTGNCDAEMRTVQSMLESGEPYDLIVTTASREYGGNNGAARAYSTAWNQVAARGTKIVVVADNPAVSAEALGCLTRFGGNPLECGTPRIDALSDADPLIEASTNSPGATLVDLTDSYCTTDRCPTVIGNVIVYRDTAGHITATYAKTVAPLLISKIEGVLGIP